jgi:hypothetical protein
MIRVPVKVQEPLETLTSPRNYDRRTLFIDITDTLLAKTVMTVPTGHIWSNLRFDIINVPGAVYSPRWVFVQVFDENNRRVQSFTTASWNRFQQANVVVQAEQDIFVFNDTSNGLVNMFYPIVDVMYSGWRVEVTMSAMQNGDETLFSAYYMEG